MSFPKSYSHSIPPGRPPHNSLHSPVASTSNLEDKINDVTLERFNEIANQDVEMQAPLSELATFLVLDTNILLHHFNALVQFVTDAERYNAPVVVIVPGVVITELDGHKKNPELRWFASTSSSWLLKKARDHNKVRGQASAETTRKSGNWRVKTGDEVPHDRLNDYLILDCCLYFARLRRTILWSGDYNLCFEAQSENIETIENERGERREWSSRYLMRAIFGAGIDEGLFQGEHVHFNGKTRISDDGETTSVDSDDAMDVDLAPNHGLVMTRSDVRDDLHKQVLDHFTTLLQEIVNMAGGAEIKRFLASGELPSRYAPEWQKNRKAVRDWSASECLQYLDGKKRCLVTSPRLDVFLRPAYSGGGARRGQDWSRADWNEAMRALRMIGRDWHDGVVSESVDTLEWLLVRVYEQSIEQYNVG